MHSVLIRTFAALSFALASSAAPAQDAATTTTPTTAPTDAKQKWDALTPAQQAAFKQEAKTQAEDKKTAWTALSPEEQAAKKTAAKEKAQPYMDNAKTEMSTRRAANTGTHRWRVNFGAESQKLGACIGVAMVRSCAQWKVVVMGALVHVKPGLREQAYG